MGQIVVNTDIMTLTRTPQRVPVEIALSAHPEPLSEQACAEVTFGYTQIWLDKAAFFGGLRYRGQWLGLCFLQAPPALPYTVSRVHWGMLATGKRFAELPQFDRVDAPTSAALHDLVTGQASRIKLTLVRPSVFQLRAYGALLRVGFATIQSYQDLAKRVCTAKAVRAIGQINARNPLPWLLPCHRVCAHDGGLGGYASGLAHKRYLLDTESNLAGATHGSL